MVRDWQKDWELCEKATPGPWYVDFKKMKPLNYAFRGYARVYTPNLGEIIVKTLRGTAIENYDAEFIAEARDALPYWLQRVRELEVKNHRRVWVVEFERVKRPYD